MAEFPALPLWTDAYLGDTTHLTTIEHGAYLLLLMAMWRSKGCSLPNDPKLLARYARVNSAQWARIWETLAPFFKVENGEITQGRLTDEATFVKRNSTRQSNNVMARWLKTKETADTTVIPLGYHSDTPTPTPTSTPTFIGGESRAGEEISTHREQLLTAMGVDPSGLTGKGGQWIGGTADMAIVGQWTSMGITESEQIAVVIEVMGSRKEPGSPSSFKYFTPAMQRLAGVKSTTLKPIIPSQASIARRQKDDRKRAFDQSIQAIAAGLDQGSIQIDTSSRDPFRAERR